MASTKCSKNVQQCNKDFMCVYDDCDKRFSSLSHLNRHEDIHKNKTYRCSDCKAVFKTQYAQKRHKDNVHLKKKPKKYKCKHCEEDFNKKSWLNRHIFKHTGIKPYMCTFKDCDARFLVPQKLARHLKIHEGYACPNENCNEKFAKWSEVRKHVMLVHPKVFKCPECEKEFSRSNNLKSHLVIHKIDRQVFLCHHEGCYRFYSSESNLKYHIKNYHEKRPYKCTFRMCTRQFNSQNDLDNHVPVHSPSRQLRKKKKKRKPKPTFAEKLAGLAPQQWQINLLKDVSKTTSTNSSVDPTHVEHLAQSQKDASNAKEILQSSSVGETCDNVPVDEKLNNDLSLNANDDDHESYCIQNNDIQALLYLVEKRNCAKTEIPAQEKKCIFIGV